MTAPGGEGSLSGSALAVTLQLAVPLWIMRLETVTPEERQRIAAEAALVVASQGDTLQYGSNRRYGQGDRALAAHARKAGNGKCPDQGCWCNTKGHPEYSAGEVFNFLARGLACLAYQPGGVTFAGIHWCTSHSECEKAA